MMLKQNQHMRIIHVIGVLAPGALGILIAWPAIPEQWRALWVDVPLSGWLQSGIFVLAAWLVGEATCIVGWGLGLVFGVSVGFLGAKWRKHISRRPVRHEWIQRIDDEQSRLDMIEAVSQQDMVSCPIIHGLVAEFLLRKHFPFARRHLIDTRLLVNHLVEKFIEDERVFIVFVRTSFLNGAAGMCGALAILFAAGKLFWIPQDSPLGASAAAVAMLIACAVFLVSAWLAYKQAATRAFIAAFVHLAQTDSEFRAFVEQRMLDIGEWIKVPESQQPDGPRADDPPIEGLGLAGA